MKVLGIDPSLRNTGLVLVELDLNTLEYEIEEMVLSQTVKSTNKQIRSSSDLLERCRILNTDAMRMANKCQMVMAELPSGSQSADGMKNYGVSIMLLGQIDRPLVQLTPADVKLAAVGSKTASKQEMIQWAVSKHPNAEWLRHNKKLTNANEHLADALGAIEAGLKTDQFRSSLQILKFSQAA